MTTPDELAELKSLVHETLDGDVLDLRAQRIEFEEMPGENSCRVCIYLHATGGDAPQKIEGEGVGLVDAVFHAVRDNQAIDYPSLKHIFFDDFVVTSDIEKTRLRNPGSDAVGTVALIIRNAEGRLFRFTDASRSTTASTANVVLRAVSHFVNAERAVRTIVGAIEEARRRNRGELVESYTMKLSELVKHVSYADVVRDARAKLK
jgi:hypothetical protein